ncbi:DNA cytosine methyltransferase [Sphingomonas lacusdianchii]|uniref:DNA cytosine methyltransferase n=1 Tax=Sphingomonas lacusdianchii TaxID=2917992 RepID=UPI001F58CC59|nr:DNA cytosine methyltransferase [Sphingomonas sp. JXJ CY 53]
MNAFGHNIAEVVIRHGHMACGLGAGAAGMNAANPRVGPLRGRFECAGGIDVDAGAIRNFERLTGVKGTVMDLFDERQYRAFHGKAPPLGWREATPADIRRVFGRLDILFASYPCKGFSGLLSARAAETAKYQALNDLTTRGMMLSLEAYADDPVAIVAFENVPRIASARGAQFLAKIDALYRAYGYVVSDVEDSIHDCGTIGGLAQSRKRFLRLFRHPSKVPNFIYQPEKKRLRGVGEVIGKLPLPGDPAAGVMHRVPALQWKTWVRLAFVPAGKDWRALNELAVVDGRLRDYGIVPERDLRENALGVLDWADTAPTLTSARSPGQGRFSVADVRIAADWNSDVLGVREWEGHTGTVAGRTGPTNGAYSVADPRPDYGAHTHRHVLGVKRWRESAATISGSPKPSTGAYSVADPRVEGHPKSVQLGVRPWSQPAPCIKGDVSVGTGPYAVSDPRGPHSPRLSNVFRIVPTENASPGRPAGSVPDPRPTHGSAAHHNKLKVVANDAAAPTITGSDRVGSGALSVADPRPGYSEGTHRNILAVTDFEVATKVVTGASHPAGGALSVADPRPVGLGKAARAQHCYNSQAHYGVVRWEESSVAVPGYAKYDRGKWSVADPRIPAPQPIEALPAPNDRLVARIIAPDNTWHRPFTTLELAALQSLFDPELVFRFDADLDLWSMVQPFDIEGNSDAMKREWIGNAVPSAAACGMAEEIGEALLLARLGETFTLSARAIWVSPLRMALAVDHAPVHAITHGQDLEWGEAS